MKTLTFYSIEDLAAALREAEQAHKQHEDGLSHDDWPSYYAAYLFEQQGAEIPNQNDVRVVPLPGPEPVPTADDIAHAQGLWDAGPLDLMDKILIADQQQAS